MSSAPTSLPPNILPVGIEEEMRRSYLDYAMSVIVARALPDARDGLKPVHRRILFAMKEGGYEAGKPFRKSARIVGDVMGKYHPHGDAAIYDAMVRMAQDFSMRLPLIDGQGNFGSMDGDPPAAMRYTEARLARAAHALIDDIDQDTVDFQPNYDDSSAEPTVLPARFPNLLVNGAGGIAVGMATNIPTHNLGEVIDAALALLADPTVTVAELIEKYIPAPDFPTGGIILGRNGIRAAFELGKGSLVLRGRATIEEIRKDRQAIVITEVPYQVNKARMVESIAEAVRDKRIEGIADLRDESDRDGVRVVVEIKRDAQADVVLNQLYRFTPLQTSFGVNMLALNLGRPELLNLKQMLNAFLTFREEVITRRTVYDLGKAREKAHVLVGLAVAVANLDEIIELIRRAPDPAEARARLMAKPWPAADIAPLVALLDEPGHGIVDGGYSLSEAQARAILDLRLHRLTGLERDKIAADLRETGAVIEELLSILRSRDKLLGVLRDELVAIKDQFATPRRTTIEESEFEQDIEDLIQREDMVVTVTSGGYIKRVPVNAYRAQRRGGKGRAGMATRDEDFVHQVFVANTHTPVLFFSSAGMAYRLKVYRLPLGNPQARGKAMVNLLPLKDGETISTVMPMPEDENSWEALDVMFATASGNVRRNKLSDFTRINVNGKIAMKLDPGDRLVRVRPCTEAEDILLFTRDGKCIRFPVADVRVFRSRDSDGVRGIKLAEGDVVVGMSALRHAEIEAEARAAYLRQAAAQRRAAGLAEEPSSDPEDNAGSLTLAPEMVAKMATEEEFVLTVTENGYGKRSSAYEYRTTGRGGSGIVSIATTARNGKVVGAFPVRDGDHIVMVSDRGQLIRCPVNDIRIAGRSTQGVTLFNLAEGERLVSLTRLRDSGEGENGGDNDSNGDSHAEPDANDASTDGP